MSKKLFSAFAALLSIVAAYQTAGAGELHTVAGCDACCCDSGYGLDVDFELAFLSLHRSDGFSRDGIFELEAAPRVAVGYEICDDFGARVRYWEFNHFEAAGQGGNPSQVDTYNIDLELYRAICLDCGLTAEFAGGIRYNHYSDNNVADNNQTTRFNAYGGTLGIELSQAVTCNGNVYARGRWSLLMGDSVDDGNRDFDVLRDQYEVGIGYEQDICVMGINAVVRGGAEWQNWEGYSDNADGAIGFRGFVLGVQTQY